MITGKEPIQFACTLCGECCSGDMKVFLNSYDLYKMGRFLNMDHSRSLFDKKLVMMDRGQNDLMLPRIRFKKQPYPFCPFLINDFDEQAGLRGFCKLHLEHKPLVCRLAPLSRIIDLDSGQDDFDFVLPHPRCPGKQEEQFIEPEKERFLLKEELEYEIRYYKLLSKHEENPDFLWHFPLEDDFDCIIDAWESD